MAKTSPAYTVTFYSPGVLVPETTTLPIAERSVPLALEMAKTVMERHGARPYGFKFATPKTGAASGMYFLGGKVETLAQVKRRARPSDAILVSNMEINRIPKVITNTNSYKVTLSFGERDRVVPWP